MFSRGYCVATSALGALLLIAACDSTAPGGLGSLFSNGSDSDGDSVADVSTDGTDMAPLPGFSLPGNEAVRARVRNESGAQVDVTLRFLRGDAVVHLAFVRVPAHTETTVASAESAEIVEASGLDDRGNALVGATFLFGVDFDENRPAEYVVRDAFVSAPVLTEPIVDNAGPSDIVVVEPAFDITLPLGSVIRTRWVDASSDPGAVVRILLRLVDNAANTIEVPVGPAVGAALDGVNDELLVVLQDIDPGLYELVGRLEDGDNHVSSVAQGRVRIVLDPDNDAPTIGIVSPAQTVARRSDEFLTVVWEDADENDNATIRFSLRSSDPTDATAESYALGPPIAEDPDEPGADSVTLSLGGVLPGRYDLVARIDDGRLTGTATAEQRVVIVPDPQNDPPGLELIQPDADTTVAQGGSFLIEWTDFDANDNARIQLFLDADLSGDETDGDEFLLVTSLQEDEDGLGDRLLVGMPVHVPIGEYRVGGVIWDGQLEEVSYSVGRVIVVEPVDPAKDDDEDNDNRGGDPNIPDGDDTECEDDSGCDGDPDGDEIAEGTRITPLDPTIDLTPPRETTIELLIPLPAIPPNLPDRVVLGNKSAGGDIEFEFTDTSAMRMNGRLLWIDLPRRLVPNDAWPRKFAATAEFEHHGLITRLAATEPIWIMQDAVVLQVEALGFVCSTTGPVRNEGATFVGYEITWSGGGMFDSDSAGIVEFWLTADRSIPLDGRETPLRRLLLETTGSPNATQTFRVDLSTVIFGQDRTLDFGTQALPELPVPPLDAGTYQLVTCVDYDGQGRAWSSAFPQPIDLCLWDAGSGIVEPR